MKMDTGNTILNQEELDFLSNLIMLPDEGTPSSKLFDYRMEGGQLEFLQRLGLADKLQVVANFMHHRFVFPIKIITNEIGMTHLSFISPEIYEEGDKQRLWRVSPQQSLSLQSKDGQPLQYSVKDISASGISLEISGDSVQIPFDLENIFLKLPCNSLIPLCGQLTRFIDTTAVAFKLDPDCANHDSLKSYLFKMHRDKYKASLIEEMVLA